MKALTEDQQKKLLGTLKNRVDAVRDYTLVSLALNTGLRREELSLLDVGDVRGKTVLFVRPEIAKRARSRRVPLNKKTQDVLRDFLAWKKQNDEGLADESPLFVSRVGKRLCIRAINDIATKWSVEAGLGEIFSPHCWRHTFGHRLRERGGDKVLAVIQRLLGHASLSSTGIYLQPSDGDLQTAVNNL